LSELIDLRRFGDLDGAETMTYPNDGITPSRVRKIIHGKGLPLSDANPLVGAHQGERHD
jgi:hypothetical protein